KAVKKHLLHTIAVLGKPGQIKTDNGPAYRSETLKQFLQDWSIEHVRGILYNSTRQAIVECAHHT
ncbi:POK19 protein, partial [Origma solitaria]|nr:POK19 protein [Origma solitaria]